VSRPEYCLTVSREHVERVLFGVDAFNRRDFDAAIAGFHPDIEWDAGSDISPEAPVYRGREGVLEFWRTWVDTMDGFTLHAEETLDLGEGRVLVMTRATGRGGDSGVPVEATFAQVWELREGAVVRTRMYRTRSDALEALGLAE
jgi:ketosteroid isomerase-like protein